MAVEAEQCKVHSTLFKNYQPITLHYVHEQNNNLKCKWGKAKISVLDQMGIYFFHGYNFFM